MTGLMNGMFTLSRFVAIFVAMKLRARTMVAVNLVIILFGNLLIAYSANTNEIGLWIGVAILGFGFGSTWPGCIAFVEERVRVIT